jgi:PIN domain nuclease of toxin-antitoxin system
VRLLLDTHVLIWALSLDERLVAAIADLLEDPANEVHVSAASAWEVAIKRALGQLQAPEDLAEAINSVGFGSLPITVGHALRAGGLPAHHRDPFDRMLVAQAQIEGLAIVTRDEQIARYDVATVPA